MDTLTTSRLTLRPFRPADADDVRAFADDPEWVRYLVNVPHPFTQQDAEAFVARFSDPAELERLPMFAIEYEGKVVGEVNLAALDLANERAELGYQLARPLWGRGLGAEAAAAVVDWGFRKLGLNRIYATCDPRNRRSIRLLEKLGMKREGLLTHHVKWHDEYRDVAYYGLLRREWAARQGVKKHE